MDDLHVDFDEDDGADDFGDDHGRPPQRRPARLLIGAVAALAALAVVLLVFGPPGDWTQPPAAKPSPTSAAGPTAAREFTITDADGIQENLPVSAGELTVAPLCAPQTDGAKTLLVSFQVVNVSTRRVRLTDAEPWLPLGLLRLRSVSAGGSCGAPGDEKLDRYLAPAQRVLVTMKLTILDRCPRPAPVGVRITTRTDPRTPARTNTRPRKLSYPLFADLGSVVFAGC